jgi:tRNA threonylcarbamoyl adenosine modification protein YeaZ
MTPNEPTRPRHTLGIEMSNPSAAPIDQQGSIHTVALWRHDDGGDTLIASAPMPNMQRGSDGIMWCIESLCTECGVQPNGIDRVIVSSGPGGYTALRIATTTAKMLAMSLGATIIAVPSPLVAAVAIEPVDHPALVALASKKDQTHATRVDEHGACEEIGIISASRLDALGIRSIFADTHLPTSIAQQARELGIALCPVRLDARALLSASAGLEPIEPIRLSPRYAREPDAVTQWRQRGSG